MVNYDEILKFIVASGDRLVTKHGKVKDIGITKTDLTEEDLVIERGLKDIINSFGKDHVLFAEEENDTFVGSENIWVSDPISGTHRFIKGESHYAIVVSHLVNHQPVFAAVYDPSVKELFSAYQNRGSFLNKTPIKVSQNLKKVIVRPSMVWKDPQVIQRMLALLQNKEIENNTYSIAINYCMVACGRFDGIVSFTKDTFPEFAGSLIIREAGGVFTNIDGQENILPSDRIFVAGNKNTYKELYQLAKKAVYENRD